MPNSLNIYNKNHFQSVLEICDFGFQSLNGSISLNNRRSLIMVGSKKFKVPLKLDPWGCLVEQQPTRQGCRK